MTGKEEAARLGVSRRTLYRWHHEGRLMCWEWGTKDVGKRPRGPRRNPNSKRYHEGRHNYAKGLRNDQQ